MEKKRSTRDATSLGSAKKSAKSFARCRVQSRKMIEAGRLSYVKEKCTTFQKVGERVNSVAKNESKQFGIEDLEAVTHVPERGFQILRT